MNTRLQLLDLGLIHRLSISSNLGELLLLPSDQSIKGNYLQVILNTWRIQALVIIVQQKKGKNSYILAQQKGKVWKAPQFSNPSVKEKALLWET